MGNTRPKYLVKFGRVLLVCYASGQTDKQKKNSHTHRNTSYQSLGEVASLS